MEIIKVKSFEEQYQERFGFPMIICISHQDSIVEYINFSNNYGNKLVCTKCILQDKLNDNHLISIKDIFSKNPNHIINNLPPLEELGLYQQLQSNHIQESMAKQEITKIENLFTQLKMDITNIIDDHQKIILTHINRTEENRQLVLEQYKNMSQKDEIKNQLQLNKDNQYELEQYFNQLIQEQQFLYHSNQQTLVDQLDILRKSNLKYQFEYIDNLFKQIMINLKQIDCLNPLFTIKQQLQPRIAERVQIEDIDSQLSEKVDLIMSLISNKTNFCTNSFLENMKDILEINKQIFNHIDFSNPFMEYCKPIQFDSLQQNELQQLAFNIENWNCEDMNFSMFGHMLQYRDLQQIENSNIYNQIDEEKNLLEQIEIIKSNYGNPGKIFIKRLSYLQIQRDSNSEIWSQLILGEKIKQNQKYQIQIQLKSQINNNSGIMLGLLPISKKDEEGWKSKLSLNTNNYIHGIDNVECGSHISRIKRDVQNITFQICLEDKILRCLTIVNNENSINSLKDWKNLKQNEDYYFYIALYYPNSIVIVNQFKTVSQFEVW